MGDGITVTGAKMLEESAQIRSSINLFSALTTKGAGEKGFHQAFEDADWLEKYASDIRESKGIALNRSVDAERLEDIAKRIRLLEVGTKLMLVVSELAEGFESLRDTGFDGHIDGEGNLGEELADACIRLGDLAGLVETQLGDDITDKMTVNKDRPYRHGRQA
jgi:NTP pyrophosphatase (non-canonical NTP hydrolase)